MNFQTSCMILVRDEQQQIELQKWMNGIGWRIRGGQDSKMFPRGRYRRERRLMDGTG